MCSVQDRANHVASRETNLKLWKASRDDISQALRNSAKTDAKNEFRRPENPIYKKKKIVAKCCRMLQDVARHYISESGGQTISRTTASKSPSRNYSKKSKSSFKEFSPLQRCKPEPPKSCKTCNTPSQNWRPTWGLALLHAT